MNVISKALNEIRYRIPLEILKVAFRDDIVDWKRAPTSLEESILTKVIRPRVLLDADIVGGQTIIVPLTGLSPRFTDIYTIIYEIPSELLANRTIMSVLSVGYLPYNSAFNTLGAGLGNINPGSSNDVLGAAQHVADAMSSIPNVSNATVDLIGYNTILIRDQLRVTNIYQLRCVVANDENLNNLNPRSYHVFSKMCELAVKSYIYNKLIITMDQAFLSGGQELGTIKEVVNSYSDAETMYQDYLIDKAKVVFFMNEPGNHSRLIKLMMNSAL